ncbi:FGFR1 oncoprotein partner [Chamberlinius hualienensis]
MATEEDAELKELVIQTLENNGVLAQIRAKLRACVFLALEENNSEQIRKTFSNNNFHQYLSTKTGKLTASLVYQFLRHFKLESTLSVYEAESQFGNLYSFDDLKTLFPELDTLSSDPTNGSLLSVIVNNFQESSGDNINKAEKMPTVPLNTTDNKVTSEVGLQAPVFQACDDVESDSSSSRATLTSNKSLSQHPYDLFAGKVNSTADHLLSNNLGFNNRDAKTENLKASGGFSLSSLNNAPPLPGVSDVKSQQSNGNSKSHQLSKHSGENDDYEDDFNSSASLNSLLKTDLNNSIEEEIEENISGNIDDPLSYDATSEHDCVTSDRTISHISTAGIDYLESIG